MKFAVLLTVALAAVAISTFPAASARELVWVGWNLDADQEYNWDNGVPTDARNDPVSWVDSRSDYEYETYLSADTYNFGAVWRLPQNGNFIFQGDDDLVIKFEESANSENDHTVFLGPREDERFDFNCPNNWNIFRGVDQPSSAQEQVPTSVDNVLFEGNSFYVFSNQRLTNVAGVYFGSDFTTDPVTDCDDLPAPHFSGIDCETFEIFTERKCVGDLQLGGDCVTFNSCPTPEQQADQDQMIIDASREAAAAEREALDAIVERNLDFEIPLTDLTQGNDALLQAFILLFSNETLKDAFEETTKSNVIDTVPGVEFTELTVTTDGEIVTFSGSVSAQASVLLKSNEEVTADGYIYYPDPIGIASVFDNALLVGAGEAFSTHAPEAVMQEIDSLLQDCLAMDMACETLFNFDEELGMYTNETSLLDIITSICGDNTCPENGDDIADDILELLSDITDSDNESDLEDLAHRIGQEIADTDIPESTRDFLDNDIHDTLDEVSNSDPVDSEMFVTPIVTFGHNLPRLVLLLFLNENNFNDFAARLSERLVVRFPWISITNIELEFEDDSQDNRRRSVDDSTRHLRLVINYVVNCLQGQCGAFEITSADVEDLLTIRDIANSVAALFSVEPNDCFVDGNGVILDEPIQSCLDDLVNVYLTDSCDVTCAINMLTRELECGAAGREVSSGTCLTDAAPGIENIIEAAVQSEQDRRDASTSSSTGGVPIPAVAGAGGAFVLILIVVVVVLRRNRSKSPPTISKEENRDIVAFENPMYGDSAVPEHHEDAIYADAADDNGLYDEPAFNNSSRDNPLYQSAENLAEDVDGFYGEIEDDQGGYLDIADTPGSSDQ